VLRVVDRFGKEGKRGGAFPFASSKKKRGKKSTRWPGFNLRFCREKKKREGRGGSEFGFCSYSSGKKEKEKGSTMFDRATQKRNGSDGLLSTVP